MPNTTLVTGNQLDLAKEIASKDIVLIADENIAPKYAAPLAKKMGVPLLTVKSSESSKSQGQAFSLIETLLKMGVHRGTRLVAIGGGIITDLVGFIASIYMRGLPLILVPTTLLAMVDASIGGKTAINSPFGKNLIGTTYPPQKVIVDFSFLETLPQEEYQNGLAEILKLGLAYDSALFCKEPNLKRAIEAKLEITQKDPSEKGLRRLLNFGHTIAHALEAASNYEISHGKAVLIGSLVESHLSMQLGYLSNEQFATIESMYADLPLNLPKRYTRSTLLQAMQHDKKRGKSGPRFVLIEKIGHALEFEGHYCTPVTEQELIPTLDWMEKRC